MEKLRDNAALVGIRQKTIVKPGGAIELESTDLPAGTAVEVIVLVTEQDERSKPELSQDEKWKQFYEKAVGMWKDDEDIDRVFAEIDRERHLDFGRETPMLDS